MAPYFIESYYFVVFLPIQFWIGVLCYNDFSNLKRLKMNAEQANELYLKHWNKKFTTMEALIERIRILSENGAYSLCVYIDNHAQYHRVASDLNTQGYGVEDYNGGNNGILEVTW
jgi:hypothetical protein